MTDTGGSPDPNSTSPRNLQRKMAKGAAWMVAFKMVDRGLGLISTLILARLLGPADYGVVGMALSFIFMAELLTAFGFDYALIHNQEATPSHYNTAWTCNTLLGVSITILMLAAAKPIADFYARPEVFWVVCALSIGPLLSGVENIGVVAFRKELDFRREFKFQVSRKILGFLIVVPAAAILRSHWALVIGILFSKLAGTVISYMMHPYRPRFELTKVREMMAFSRWILVNNLINFLRERSSDFFIGRSLGPNALGGYNVAYELSNLPTTEISAPINRALLPGFARMETSEEIVAAYSVALGLMAMLALPAAAAIMALAPFLVPVVLGSKWLSIVPLMEILAFNGATLLFHSSIAAVLAGRGQPRRTTVAGAAYVAILLVTLSVLTWHGRQFGVVAYAYAVLAISVLCTPIFLVQVRRAIGIPASIFVRAIARPIVAAAALVAAVRLLLPTYAPTMDIVTAAGWLVVGGIAGVATYIAALWLLWTAAGRPAGAERTVLDSLRALWSRLAHRAARHTG
jgi:O-antigen/teichoic acid export membrane protein